MIALLIVAGGGDTYRGPLRVDTAAVSTVRNRRIPQVLVSPHDFDRRTHASLGGGRCRRRSPSSILAHVARIWPVELERQGMQVLERNWGSTNFSGLVPFMLLISAVG
jgi:hypothetical protein